MLQNVDNLIQFVGNCGIKYATHAVVFVVQCSENPVTTLQPTAVNRFVVAVFELCGNHRQKHLSFGVVG